MKNHLTFISLLIGTSLWLSQPAQALIFGQAAIGGAGCVLSSENINVRLSEDQTELILPVSLVQIKDESKRVDHVSCSVAIPVQLSENEKLAITSAQFELNSYMEKEMTTNLQFEVFKSGSRGKVNKVKLESADEELSVSGIVRQNKLLMTAENGQSFILRMNLSSTTTGSGISITETGLMKLGVILIDGDAGGVIGL